MQSDRDGLYGKANYGSGQIASVIRSLSIKIEYETSNDFICFCPFHDNTHSASFSVSKVTGQYICFNPSCESRGSLVFLVKSLKKLSELGAKMHIDRLDKGEDSDIEKQILLNLEPNKLTEFSPEMIERLYKDFAGSPAEKYMIEQRGFTKETLEHFKVGFSLAQNYVTIPVFDADNMPLGFVGRSIVGKEFKNSSGLPKSKTLFNINNAKKHESVIVCEATFDAMRIHQAGYPNVVALIGGSLSDTQKALFKRYFSRVIIMTDDDKKKLIFQKKCPKCKKSGKASCAGHNPGRELGASISSNLSDLDVYWATYDATCIYPHDAKDAADMTDIEISKCVQNATPDFEYTLAKLL